jgi:translocator protein
MRKWIALVAWVAAPLLLGGGIGRLFAPGEWFEQLAKPEWNPPGWVFGPVWTTLYILMGLAAWLVWEQHGFRGAARTALGLFIVHLLFNAAWSAIFFGLQAPGLAFAEIVLLWGMILALVVLFWRLRPLAGMLLVPYLAWVTFAAVLNFSIWQLN